MKTNSFIVSSGSLLKALLSIGGVVSNNPIVPILENFLFDQSSGRLVVSASDLQTTLQVSIDVESSEDFKFCAPAKLLLDTLKGLAEQPVTFKVNTGTYSVEIISSNGSYKISGENPADYVKTPVSNGGVTFTIPADVIGAAISTTLFATSTDDLRPAMTGVYLTSDENSLTFAATDGHKLVRYIRSDVKVEENISVIIQRKAMAVLKSCLPESGEVVIEFSKANAFFTFGNIKMSCRLLDERYPDYRNAIPTDSQNHLEVNRMELLSSLKRIGIYSNKMTHQIRLQIANNELQVSAEDLDYSNEASEKLKCEYNGEDLLIGFNAKFLVEVLSNITSRNVRFEMSAPNRAALVYPMEQKPGEDITMLVMPVMLNPHIYA